MLLKDAVLRAKKNIEMRFFHASYKRACDLRTLYLQIVTGSNIDKLLPQFELRETPELYQQRKEITVQNLTPVSAPVAKKFFGVSRVEPAEKRFTADNKNKQKYLQICESDFYAGDDLDAYLTNYIDRVNLYDPNAFYVLDFFPFAPGEIPKPYPIIFQSPLVRDWAFDSFGKVDFLFCAVEKKVNIDSLKGDINVIDYYVFVAGHTIEILEAYDERNLNTEDSEKWEINQKAYVVYVRNTSSKAITVHPAKRLGYIIDDEDPNLFVSPFHPAIPVFLDLIHDKSEYDIGKRMHVFPQKVMYDKPCPGETYKNPSRLCNGGKIAGTSETCTTCNGEGFAPHRSGQEVIKFKMPADKSEYIPLDELVSYIKTDFDAIKLLGDDLLLNAQRVEAAIFSAGAIKKQTVSGATETKTATEMIITSEEYNFVLDAWAKNRSNMFVHTLTFIGQIFDTKVTVVHRYAGQYIRETVNNILPIVKLMLDANVSPVLVNDAEYRVAKIQYDNDPQGMAKFLTQKAFSPFAGKSASEIASLRNSDNVPKRLKVLHDNFSYIFSRIENTIGVSFYEDDYKQQQSTIEAIVDELLGIVKAEEPKPTLRNPTF